MRAPISRHIAVGKLPASGTNVVPTVSQALSNQSAANSGKARRTLLDLPTYLV